MEFPTPLVPGTLIRRYKRFLADVRLDDGREIVAHCPNTGAMTGLDAAGARVWLEPNNDPKKKLDYGWRLLELPGENWAGIDAMVPNRVMREALNSGKIPELSNYKTVRAEVPYGKASRVDFLLIQDGLKDCYLEVKNVHLSRETGWAEFPDAATARGAKHLRELADMVSQGHRSIMFYLVQRTDCTRFRLAQDVDKNYADAFAHARKAGVEVMCFDTLIDTSGVTLGKPLEVVI